MSLPPFFWRRLGPGEEGFECADLRNSIKEFCEPTMPVYMFDKKGNFHVLTVEQVSFLFFYDNCTAAGDRGLRGLRAGWTGLSCWMHAGVGAGSVVLTHE